MAGAVLLHRSMLPGRPAEGVEGILVMCSGARTYSISTATMDSGLDGTHDIVRNF